MRDLGLLGIMPWLLVMGALFWICFRFGLLAGVGFTVSHVILSIAGDYLAIDHAFFSLLGGSFLLLWLVLATISLYLLFESYPQARGAPASPGKS